MRITNNKKIFIYTSHLKKMCYNYTVYLGSVSQKPTKYKGE